MKKWRMKRKQRNKYRSPFLGLAIGDGDDPLTRSSERLSKIAIPGNINTDILMTQKEKREHQEKEKGKVKE